MKVASSIDPCCLSPVIVCLDSVDSVTQHPRPPAPRSIFSHLAVVTPDMLCHSQQVYNVQLRTRVYSPGPGTDGYRSKCNKDIVKLCVGFTI